MADEARVPFETRLTPEAAARLELAWAEACENRLAHDRRPALILEEALAKHGLRLHDATRGRSQVDERVYESALQRSHYWREIAERQPTTNDEITGEYEG